MPFHRGESTVMDVLEEAEALAAEKGITLDQALQAIQISILLRIEHSEIERTKMQEEVQERNIDLLVSFLGAIGQLKEDYQGRRKARKSK
jgi:hypothetical protein